MLSYPTFEKKLKKIESEVGIGIKWVNILGLMLFAIGILTLIGTGLVLSSGRLLPFEISIIYFFEVLSKNFYLTFLISIIVSFLGFKLMTWEKFMETKLNLNDKDLDFKSAKRKVVIRYNRVTDFYQIKSDNKRKLVLKSDRGELYNFRLTDKEFKNLVNNYPLKIKTLGNNI